ncbi:hypothetical protein ZIOFF_021177 [Zingiber officinale]|uniref:Protein kinase domain-containing protein n=1 Tax=Zingiber officinale TaxID=94328 RepID=A0A8J5H1G8_ZINOF|nr:hypothetical protein ZIOFF_021177 [Zingiber officinale]
MNCFSIRNEATKGVDSQARMSGSIRSNSTTSTEHDMRRSGSEFNSGDVTDISSGSMGRSHYPSFSQKPNNLRVFTFSELRNATRNFSRSLMGHKEWLTEVNVLGVLEHPNLVKLVGYCAEDDERGIQRLLVYEYMPNRSVDDHLSNRSRTTLSWPMRLRVALDAARGLAYLHEEMEFQIIFRDFKTSNILLDKDWKAKLSDFGMARQGPTEGITHVSTAVSHAALRPVVGTLGYAAPEYLQTGRLTSKSDVWSYGVVLYELVTGRRPIDRNRPRGEQKLLEWVKPYITDAKKLRIIMDTKLQDDYSLKSATRLVYVANRCLVRLPKSRPKMSEVVEMLRQIVGDAEVTAPQAPLRSSEEKTTLEKKKGIKRAMGDRKMCESLGLGCHGWMLKLVKTH